MSSITSPRPAASLIARLLIITAVIGSAVSFSKVYIFHITLAALLVFVLYHLLITRRFHLPVLHTRLHLLFPLMLLWYGLSSAWSLSWFYSLKYFTYILLGVLTTGTCILSSQDRENLDLSFLSLKIIMAVNICVSLFEAFTPWHLPVSPYAVHFTTFSRSSTYFPSSVLPWVPTSFHWNPNNLALAVLMTVPFFLFHKNLLVKSAGYISAALVIIASGSRGIFIALSAVTALYLLVYSRKRALLILYIMPFLLPAAFLVYSSASSSGDIKIREISASFTALRAYVDPSYIPKKTSSLYVRRKLISHGLQGLKESRFLGIGGGATPVLMEKVKDSELGRIRNMHNFWIEVLVEAGLLFFLIYLVWYLLVTFKLYTAGLRCRDPQLKYYLQSLSLVFAGFVVGCISPSSTVYFLLMWLMFGMGIAALNVYNREQLSPAD